MPCCEDSISGMKQYSYEKRFLPCIREHSPVLDGKRFELYRFTAESLLYDCVSRLFERIQSLFTVFRFRQNIVGVVGGDGEDGDAALG